MFDSIPNEILSRFALYLRIEPRCRRDDFQQGIEARSADPLWYLARQWQMGEFQGEDNGSPIRVEVDYHSQLIKGIQYGESAPTPLQTSPPIETIIEQEPVMMNWRLRIRIGQQFERFLIKYIPEYAKSLIITYRKPEYYPVEVPEQESEEYIYTDRATRRYLHLMSGRAINGESLINDILDDSVKVLPADLTDEITSLNVVFDKLKEWYLSLYVQTETSNQAWTPHQMNYQFDLTAENPDTDQSAEICIPDYRNGDLDWYNCELKTRSDVPADLTVITKSFNPTRIEFAGKPNERWWTFEDHAVDFGKMDIATTDLVRTMLMEYAFVYADDWFIVPLDVPIGSLTRIRNLRVSNAFGDNDAIRFAANTSPNPLEVWNMYKLSGDTLPIIDSDPFQLTSHLLFIPPAINHRQESEPIEEVRFIRDEGANLVFAIEHTVSNQLGTPVKGYEFQLEKYNREKEPLKVILEAALTLINQEKTGLEIELEALEEELHGEPDPNEIRLEMIANRKAEIRETIKTIEAEIDKYQRNIDILENPDRPLEIRGLPQYRLANTVPDNWIPYVPVNASRNQIPIVRLRQAQMLRNVDRVPLITDNPEIDLSATELMQVKSIEPLSRILKGQSEEEKLEWLNEEAVLRSGLKIQITKQRIRWFDGKTYVWLGRKVLTGRGEGSSGLKFDYTKKSM